MPPATSPPPAAPPPITGAGSELLEPGEKMIVVVKRTVVGLVIIYLEALAVVLALVAIGIFVAPDLFGNLSDNSMKLVAAGMVFAIALLVLILLIVSYVYRQSRFIVTDRSLIQVLQKSLFIRTVSRLSMSNVEDVTAEQRGILPTMFNYGTLVVQTAGEMDNFVFPWCPDPNKYAHRILEARQAYAQALEADKEP